jgi:AraC-like DNA-binding protein
MVPVSADLSLLALRTPLALTLGSLRELDDDRLGPLPAAARSRVERARRYARQVLELLDRCLGLPGDEEQGAAETVGSGSVTPPIAARQPTAELSPSSDEAFLARALAVIDEHLGDEEFGVDELACQLAVSRSQLYRRLEGTTDASPAQLLLECRLERAARLLAVVDTVSEVAHAVGFKSLSHFSQRFRERFGVPPSSWREQVA